MIFTLSCVRHNIVYMSIYIGKIYIYIFFVGKTGTFMDKNIRKCMSPIQHCDAIFGFCMNEYFSRDIFTFTKCRIKFFFMFISRLNLVIFRKPINTLCLSKKRYVLYHAYIHIYATLSWHITWDNNNNSGSILWML